MSKAHSNLIARLEEAAARFDELTAEMNDPAVASDAGRIVAVATEHASLGRLVEPYRSYVDLEDRIGQARAIMDDPSAEAELKELAAAEIEELSAQAESLMAEIQGRLVDTMLAAPR